MNSMKKLVLMGAVVALVLSFPLPAMAAVCQPTDVDCVEPPAQTPSDTPSGPQPGTTQCGFIQMIPEGGSGQCHPVDPNWDTNVWHPGYDPCAVPMQSGNAGSTDISGGDIQIDPSTTTDCTQTIPPPQGGGVDDRIDYGGCACPEEVIH
jgi:hypothetical protein